MRRPASCGNHAPGGPTTLVPAAGRYYRHDDAGIRTEGIEHDTFEFPNGHSHVQAGLLSSSSQTIRA